MTPKERAIAAMNLKQPDMVPTFELEFQLTEEYFGVNFHQKAEWQDATPRQKERFINDNAELYVRIAEFFDYSIIMDSFAYYPSIKERMKSIAAIRKLAGEKYMLIVHGDGTYAIPEGNNMLDFTYSLADKSDEMKLLAEKMIDDAAENAKIFVDAGVDGFALCSDYCLNTGPFLSPKMFSEFVTPYLAKLIHEYRKMGMYTIKHTDGNIMPIIDQLVACEPHALHSLDPQAKVDIKEVKRLYGKRVCLIGNVMCSLLQTGTEQEILDSARYAMENGKPAGGYIFSTSNVIFKGVQRKSYNIVMDYYRKNRVY